MKSFIDFSPRVVPISSFRNVLHVLLTLMLTNLVCLIFNVSINFSILYGPILYLYILSKEDIGLRSNWKIGLHLAIASVIMIIGALDLFALSDAVLFTHVLLYFILIYNALLNQKAKEFSNVVFSFISIVALLTMTNITAVTGLELSEYFGYDIFSQNKYLSAMVIVFYIIFTLISLQELNRTSTETDESNLVQFNLEEDSIPITIKNQFIRQKIEHFFQTDSTYLDPTFTLEKFALSIDENKEVISMVLNKYMKTNFYQIVAKYRIEQAKKLIVKEHNVTIDAIMEECGFNSKSSFNKYFKQFVGSTPSSYRNTYSIV